MKDTYSISIQRQILLLSNKKAEEYYSDAERMAKKAIESKLPKTQVSNMLNIINTTTSSTEFLNYLKRQIGKAHSPLKSSSKSSTNKVSAWITKVRINQDSNEEKAFGEALVEKLENVRQQAISDADDRKEMEIEDKIRLCILYLRQFLKAFEAHYLYNSPELLDK